MNRLNEVTSSWGEKGIGSGSRPARRCCSGGSKSRKARRSGRTGSGVYRKTSYPEYQVSHTGTPDAAVVVIDSQRSQPWARIESSWPAAIQPLIRVSVAG